MFATCVKGRLTKDAELRYTRDGDLVCNLRVVHNRRIPNPDAGPTTAPADQWIDAETTFYRITIWGRRAENVSDLKRGEAIIAEVKHSSHPKIHVWTTAEGDVWLDDNGAPRADMTFTASEVARVILPDRPVTGDTEWDNATPTAPPAHDDPWAGMTTTTPAGAWDTASAPTAPPEGTAPKATKKTTKKTTAKKTTAKKA